jgi:hypothetical protein
MIKRNFKMRALESEDGLLTKGKVYEFVNGVTMLDRFESCRYESVEDFQKTNNWAKVEEVKEEKDLKFNVGDKILNKKFGKGTVIYSGNSGCDTLVEYDSHIPGLHDGNGIHGIHRNTEKCYWHFADSLKLFEPQSQLITITAKGREVIATLTENGKFVKSAKATCNPSDIFDFEIGKKLAVKRLMGEDVKNITVTIDAAPVVKAVKKVAEAVKDVSLTAKDFKVGDKVKVVAKKSGHCFPIGEIIKLIESGHCPKWKAITINGKKYNGSECWYVGEDEIEAYAEHTDMFDWQSFKSGKFAVHCDTVEKAREFLKECDEHGIKWCTGQRPITEQKETRWEAYKFKTSYSCDSNGGLMYGTADKKNKIDYTPSKSTVKEIPSPVIIKQSSYAIGDKVKVRENLNKISDFKDLTILNEMKSQAGTIIEIVDAWYAEKVGAMRYKGGTHTYHSWSNECFEGKVVEPTETTIKPVVKEAKRHAKAGEWVRVVNAHNTKDNYKNGDILQIIPTTWKHPHYKDEIGCYLEESEYVVLEGYIPEDKPTVKEVKRPARVGEWIKVIHATGHGYKNGDIACVVDVSNYYIIIKAKGNHYGLKNQTKLTGTEYVVLENYIPEEPTVKEEPIVKQPFQKAKVGDKIKVVKVNSGHGPVVNNGDVQTVTSVASDAVQGDHKNWFYDRHQEYIIIEEAKPEVKRVSRKAEIGEYIEIVANNGSGENEYKNGDILQVVKSDYTYFDGCAYYKNKIRKYANLNEYVVLENYQPEINPEIKSEPTPETIEVGDTVRVVDSGKTCSYYRTFIETNAKDFTSKFVKGYSPKNGDTGIVVGQGKHDFGGDYYVVLSNGKAFCIGEKGIKKIQ